MNPRHCFWTIVIVYLLLSFVPGLLLPNLLKGFRGGKG